MNNMSFFKVLGGVIAVIGLSATGAHAVAITNGGFEANASSVPASGVYFGPITGWNATGQLISSGYYSAAAPEGRVFALVGDGGDSGGYHQSQTISGLTSGTRYTVKFELGGEDWRDPGFAEQVKVFMSAGSGSAFQTFSAPVSSNTTPYSSGPLWDHWGFYNYSFVANSTSATIDFMQTAGLSDTGLDNVSISTGVPEPAAWALMPTGFGVLGGALRARRRLVAV